MKIAVTTPTGNIGSWLVDNLLHEGGHDLVLLCRDPSRVRRFLERGAEVRKGDLNDPEYVVDATCGVDLLFWLTPPRFDAEDFVAFQRKLGDIAATAVRANRIPRVVNLSSIGAQHPAGHGPIAGLHAIEQKLNDAVREVGGSICHLRPAAFYENFFAALPGIRTDGAIYMPVPGDARVALIGTRDIAEAAARVVTDISWQGIRVIELLGPETLSHDEIARIIGEALGRKVRHVQVPAEDAVRALQQFGASENTARTFVEMYEAIPRGLLEPEFPREQAIVTPTTLEEFARAAIAPAAQD
ncbi:MAG: NmrA family NAD(P)-binding protein [Planctomycetes bacterium]|nr:NmrA family NAD(P)-binding protein [Planctomycetota bacterium]